MISENSFKSLKSDMTSQIHKTAMDYNFFFLKIERCYQEYYNRLEKFLNTDCRKYFIQKKKIYDKHRIDSSKHFNIFESISDKWYRENFHSDILYTILNPETPEIGNKLFVKNFVKFLGINFDYDNELKVIKEQSTGEIAWKDKKGNEIKKEGRIDLLITNKSQAIIIENKINYAPDMENQLVRYIKFVHDKDKLNKDVSAVVYLTLTGDKNLPSPSSFAKSFQKEINILEDENVKKEVCAVGTKKDLVLAQDFLKPCIISLQRKHQDKARFYIDQYSVLLNHLGGYAYMSKNDKKLIKTIFSTKDDFELAQDLFELWKKRNKEGLSGFEKKFLDKIKKEDEIVDAFVDVWSRRDKIIPEILFDDFSENDGSTWDFDEDIFYYPIIKDSLCVYYSPKENQIGYWTKVSKNKKILSNTLKELKGNHLQFESETPETWDDTWIYYNYKLDYEENYKSIEKLLECIKKTLNAIIKGSKKYKKLINQIS